MEVPFIDSVDRGHMTVRYWRQWRPVLTSAVWFWFLYLTKLYDFYSMLVSGFIILTNFILYSLYCDLGNTATTEELIMKSFGGFRLNKNEFLTSPG